MKNRDLTSCETEMAWSPWLIIFVIIACLMIIASIVVAILYFKIDTKRKIMLKKNYPVPRDL
uniref:Uncharacterized protein n=1 Tax=Onchocerca volvulus TaxID=6282 RepID=A0A8R1TVY9_ONCVO